MDILNNIEWFISSEPKTAINKDTNKNITKKEFDSIVFDDSVKENVRIELLLNDNYLFFETREIQRPVTVKQLLTVIYKFYKEPLNHDNIDNAFEEMEEWKDDIIDYYDGDISKLINFDVFTDTCTPDFCGITLNEESGAYIINIGPE